MNIEDLAKNNALFGNHYRLIRPLSTDGGTADVWLATDINSQELVAIKIYRPKNALDIDGERIFRDEYKIVHNCRHTNLLQPTHFSIFQDTPYLELPYCKNGSSEKLVGKHMTEKEIWMFIKEVAEGLAYLHALNPPIIHQDIKPANILIDDNGNYAITDFGISATLGGGSNDYSLDEEYSGTMAYMAPERFDENHVPMSESDIWAFGVTLYEILTGNVPFGDYGGQQQQKENRYASLPKSVPFEVRRLIDSCLDITPAKRPTAKDMAERAKKHLRSVFSRYAGYIAFICALIVAGGVLLGISKQDNEQNKNPQTDTVVVHHISKKSPEDILHDAVDSLNYGSPIAAKHAIYIIDSLASKNYAPAMHEYVLTYAMLSNRESVNRKHILGVKCYNGEYDRYMPQDNSLNQKTERYLYYLIQHAEKESVVAESAYTLACYYVTDNHYKKINIKEGKRLLNIALESAKKAKDDTLINNCINALKVIQK